MCCLYMHTLALAHGNVRGLSGFQQQPLLRKDRVLNVINKEINHLRQSLVTDKLVQLFESVASFLT